MKFNIPNAWEKISESEYAQHHIQNDAKMKCEAAYKVSNNGSETVVTYYYLGKGNSKYLDLIEKINIENQEINELIDGDENAGDYEDTSLSRLICHKRFKANNKEYFMHISKLHLDETVYANVFQIYALDGDDFYCCQCYLPEENICFDSNSLNKNYIIGQILESVK